MLEATSFRMSYPDMGANPRRPRTANGVERERDISKRYIIRRPVSTPKTKRAPEGPPRCQRLPRALVGHPVANQDELAAALRGGGPVDSALHGAVIVAVAE